MMSSTQTNPEALLARLLLEIKSVSEAVLRGDKQEEELLTAQDLAREFNLRLDSVKKKLRILKQEHLIHPVSISPKRYRVDIYTLQHLPEEHPLYPYLLAD